MFDLDRAEKHPEIEQTEVDSHGYSHNKIYPNAIELSTTHV